MLYAVIASRGSLAAIAVASKISMVATCRLEKHEAYLQLFALQLLQAQPVELHGGVQGASRRWRCDERAGMNACKMCRENTGGQCTGNITLLGSCSTAWTTVEAPFRPTPSSA